MTPRDIDSGRSFDWGRTSRDYALHRPGPPDSFYRRLAALDVGLPGQRMLDLGTGTGVLARRFASSGALASGVDIAPEQIRMAEELAREQGLSVDLRVAAAEDLPYPAASFDCVTANQCWLYFDLASLLPELRRVLAPQGRLVISFFSFLPRLDPLVHASEQLVLRFNPDWDGADWHGRVAAEPRWSRESLELVGMFFYDESIPFTRESWRGRMRALRGIGATLTPDQVDEFDRAHAELLRELVPDEFGVLHRISVHIFAFKQAES